MLTDTPRQAEVVFIVDLSNLAYRSYYGNKDLRTTTGIQSGHVFGSIKTLLARFREFNNTTVCPIFCYDGFDARKSRKEVYPEYKENRTKHDFCPVSDVKDLCLTLPGLHIEQEYLEGDDAIVWASILNIPKETVVFTGDSDLWSLMRIKTLKVYSPNKGRFVEEADWINEYHVKDPSKIYIAKALFGDNSDNIKGVKGLIRKQVEPILNDEKCVDISSFYDMIVEKPDSITEKMYSKIQESKDRILLNYQIIKPNISSFTKKAVKQSLKNEENKNQLLCLLNKFECFSVINEINQLYK